MYYSSSLLKKFISVADSPENIANDLILKVCEIEEVVERKLPDGVVIGYVDRVEKHPEADKLSVCQVNCGDKGNFQILCGANNVREGIFVPVALSGTYLPAVSLQIEPRKMRGMESNGMICAKAELGIKEDADQPWIWILTDDFDDVGSEDKGFPLVKKHPRLEGWVMDVENKGLTHRPDLTGHFGLANEIFAMYQDADARIKISSDALQGYLKDFAHSPILDILGNANKAKSQIKVGTDALRSYVLLEIDAVQVKSSSFFARLELTDLGVTPKNNWVDFSNVFMLLTGQPVHFFDADKVAGNIVVRYAKNGEKFADLQGGEHILQDRDIVIADEAKVLALAGVMGGANSAISADTKRILVEIANFDPVLVRKTGVRLGLRTDAELRFEKNINPVWSLYSLLLFLDFVKYYQKDLGAFQLGGISFFVGEEAEKSMRMPKEVSLDVKKLFSLVFGEEVQGGSEAGKFLGILEDLGFEKTSEELGKISYRVPMWRGPDDMNIEADLIEEIARIYGYDRISQKALISEDVMGKYAGLVGLQRRLESFFVQDGRCDQLETYPWVETQALNDFGVDTELLCSVANSPTDASLMRDSLVYNLFEYVAKNAKFFDDIRICDAGSVWKKSLDDSLPLESVSFASFFYKKQLRHWSEDPLFEVKNLLRELFDVLGLKLRIEYEISHNVALHPKKQAVLKYNNQVVGSVGAVHPLLVERYKMPGTACAMFCELDMFALIELLDSDKHSNQRFLTLQDQIVSRDLCFVVDVQQDFSALVSSVRSVERVSGVSVFDLYQGDSLPEGKKSIAFSFDILGDGTMTTDAINAVMAEVIAKVEATGAVLRKG